MITLINLRDKKRSLFVIIMGFLCLFYILHYFLHFPAFVNKMVLSLLLTYAISSGFLAWLVGWQYIWTKKSKEQLIYYLKKQKSLRWYFELNEEKQWWIKIVVIGLLFLLCYMVISSEIWYWICYRILQLIGRKSFSADDQESKKAAPSSQQEAASNSGQERASKPGSKAHGSSSKPQPSPSQKDSKEKQSSTKGKASTSAKKNRSSAKATPSDSNKASKQSSKGKANSGVTLHELLTRDDAKEDDNLIADLQRKARLEKKPPTEGTFTDLEFEKGGFRNKVTKMERGDTSKEVYRRFDSSPGNTAEELSKYLAGITKSDPIFDD